MKKELMVAIGVAALVCAGLPAHAAVDARAVCKEKKAKAAGKKASDLLKAFGKNVMRPGPPRLAIDLSKARSKFEKAFSKAETGARCLTIGDAGTIEGIVDGFVIDAVGRLCPSCGDGILASNEECDDADLEDGDGCSGLCVVEAGWSCGGEPSSCSEICGDGIVVGAEECDAGGAQNGGCCSPECVSGAGECCTLGLDLLSFETGIPSGTCGVLSNFRCGGGDSHFGNHVCDPDNGNAGCDFGPCFTYPGLFFCSGDFSISCTDDSDCTGTCGEVSAGNLPLDLECGGVYVGGGLNSMPLPVPAPDRGEFFLRVNSCNETTGEMTLGPTTPAEVGTRHCTQGRQCSNDGSSCVLDTDCGAGTCEDLCLIGAPMPLPNAGTPPTSVCIVNVIAEDASGTAQCSGGDVDLDLALRAVVYFNGDLFKSSTPPDLPGAQPCPLCVPICSGGSNNGWPCRTDNPNRACEDGPYVGKACTDDSDCPNPPDPYATCAPARTEYTDCIDGGGTCPSETVCLGGLDHGDPCTPETSDSAALGDNQDSYPTSHDCGNDPFQDITAHIGGLPVIFNLTTGTDELNAVDRPNGSRVFCGFCRDVLGLGSLCFEGDPAYGYCWPFGNSCQDDSECFGGPCLDAGGCPTAIPPADGNAVPCTSDADCDDGDEYESCVQRNPGGFSEAASTRISVTGAADGQCLADGEPHPADLASIFCMAPTFDATVDAATDLPGPGAVMLQGDVQLQ